MLKNDNDLDDEHMWIEGVGGSRETLQSRMRNSELRGVEVAVVVEGPPVADALPDSRWPALPGGSVTFTRRGVCLWDEPEPGGDCRMLGDSLWVSRPAWRRARDAGDDVLVLDVDDGRQVWWTAC